MMPTKIGHYTIVSELGRGGMGVVYKAHEESLNRFVAIKVLGEQLASDPAFVARFVREAQAAAGLNHPNIIQIFFIGEDNGQHYFVMEYVSGKSLLELVREESRIGNPRAAQYIQQAAMGLAAAHDKGILHRDIKPANLIVDSRGLVKIADFGLALPQDAATRLTTTGTLMGTPGYLSPEQCLGKTLDRRTDIYSLGVTYFETLTGSMPFQADSPLALLRKILDEAPPDIASLNDTVDADTCGIVNRMIARDRDQRYQSCHELVADLDEYLAGKGVRRASGGLVAYPASSAAGNGETTRLPRPEATPVALPVASPAGAAPPSATPAPIPPTVPSSFAPAAVAQTTDSPTPAKAATAAAAVLVPAPPAAPVPVSAGAAAGKPSRTPVVALALVAVFVVAAAALGFLAFRMPATKSFLASFLRHGKAGTTQTQTAAPSTGEAPSEASAAVDEKAPQTAGRSDRDDSGPASQPRQSEVETATTARRDVAGTEARSSSTPGSSTEGASPSESGAPARVAQAAGARDGVAGTAPQGGAGGSTRNATRRVRSRPGVADGTVTRHRGRAASEEVAVASIGVQPLAGVVSGVLQTELQNAGLQPIDAASLSSFDQAFHGRGEPTVADLLSAARGEGMARLVVARVEPAGERQLNYMGRVDVAYSARVTLTCYDTGSGRPTGPSASTIVEYTTLSVERATEKAMGPLIEAITEQAR